MIPYGKQEIISEDVEAVLDVLKSDFLTQGPQVPMFEKSVSTYCEARYGVAVNSATSALHIACLALGLDSGDWLWTSSNSFVASANCGYYCGANVDFVDIDEDTYNMSVIELEKKLVVARQKGKLPKIVIPVHFAGQSCHMKEIYALSLKYGFKIIEDASHAIGGQYLGEPVGGCKYSDITVFSFHPVKIITTAEGGLATTNSEDLMNRMHLYRSHGVTKIKEMMSPHSEGDWFYQQIGLGFNYRMTEIQAALGCSQIKRLDSIVEKRHELKERYDRLLGDLPVTLPRQADECYSSLHLYPIQLKLELLSKTRKQIFSTLREQNIGVNVHYIPIHTQPFYQKKGFEVGDFPKSENYYEKAISLPLFPTMHLSEQDQVVEALQRSLE